MALMRRSANEDVMVEINITPFTDVLLVLLIIFMLLATLVTPPGFEKSLPNGGASSASREEVKVKNIEIAVDAPGNITIDGRRTDGTKIYRDLARVAHARGKIHVAIVAEKKAPYAAIIRILDAAKVAHLNDGGFVANS